jgi:hypothetical protein
MKPLSELIRDTQEALNAIAAHPEYTQLQDSDALVGLDVTLGDCELFLDQLSQALYEATKTSSGGSIPTLPEDNPLQTPERRKLTLTQIMQRPMPPITPEMQSELDGLDHLFNGGK